jgi:predicted short-subunit dehydrogenase-like oxidoreductase (DUF2520 family)
VIETVQLIGAGRVGAALAARLEERGVELRADDAELVLLCVPDGAVAEVARSIETGPWIAHVSGATPGTISLEALTPLMRRTIENGFELTGPIERGDWETVEAHRRAIRATRPDLEPLYDVLAEATAR